MSVYSMLKAALRAQGWILARVPEDDELYAAELVDLLTEDNAGGRARRFALASWLTFERPVIARFPGETCNGREYVRENPDRSKDDNVNLNK